MSKQATETRLVQSQLSAIGRITKTSIRIEATSYNDEVDWT